ncbi:MAG: hypothetical protein IKZ43_11185 [Acidaminococcaceae bacterium]|nr:hypothetical protein [Acidaminococcaceae bacterium]
MEFTNRFLTKKTKIGVGVLLTVIVAGIITMLVLAQLARRGAAEIFNREMEKQTMLRGTITVESLMAHITGDVSFENLVWKEPDGDLVLHVPEGSFHVRPWDVITRNFKSTTIQQLTLKNAVISVRFDENMQVDFLDQKPAKLMQPKEEKEIEKEKEKDTEQKQEQIEEEYVYDDDGINFNPEGRRLRTEIVLDDCRLEARYRKRHYVLNNVHMKLGLHTSGMSHIDLSTGKFGGTMRGGGMSIYGAINFKGDKAVADVDVSVRDVDPSSLGFGMNVHDLMTVVARLEGPVTGPMGRGTVKMKELNIPALRFTDVIGDVTYSNALFRFSDVHAKVFGGTLLARGYYHMDSRKYRIYGNGKALDSKRALRNLRFSCPVDLNINLECDGNPRNILAYGDFKSGKGHYSIIPFDSLQGRFTNRFKELHIYDAVIDTQYGVIRTDAFSIINSKLHLGKITLTDPDTGQIITVREEKNDDKAAVSAADKKENDANRKLMKNRRNPSD